MTHVTEIRFVSGNPHKLAEAEQILNAAGVTLRGTKRDITELQTNDIDKLIRHKVLQVFKKVGRPLFVEHTGLALEHLNGFPGGLTQIFWDTLQADKFSELFGKLAPVKTALAQTHIAYCDGYKIHTFKGSIRGVITPEPRGQRDFQWDCVFQPDGYAETFAEMGDKKNGISMRKIALDEFRQYLETQR